MSCENCGSCRGGCGLLLTEAELALLRRLGETPFLPIAAAFDRKTPVYLEDPERSSPPPPSRAWRQRGCSAWTTTSP